MDTSAKVAALLMSSCALVLTGGPVLAAWIVPSTSASGTSSAAALGAVTAGSSSSTDSSASFNWIVGTGAPAGGYIVERAGTVVCSGVATSCTVDGLSPSTTYSYEVRPVLQAWTGPSTVVRVTTSAPAKADPRFTVEVTSAGNPTVGTPTTYRITATNGAALESAYTGSKTLAFSGLATSPGGRDATAAGPVYPSSSVSFTAGVATVTATSHAAGAQSLSVADGARTGAAAPVLWVTAGPYTTGWAGCAQIDRAAVLSITVSRGTDGYGNPAPTSSAVSYTLNNRTGNVSGNPATIPAGATVSNVVTVDPSNDKGSDLLTGSIVSPVAGYPATWTCTYNKI